MPSLNEDQLKLLKKLKKDLQQEEHEQQSLSRVSEAVPPCRDPQADDLFKRLASQKEGIQYRINERWVPASLGELDSLLFRFATHIGAGPAKMAIGLPRVPVGISTWLAVSVMISRVAFSRLNPPSGYSDSGIRRRWILIACRERSLRDLYISQRILFASQSFLINSFPIYRFRRDGGIQPISLAKPNKLSTPVMFYHFDNIDFAHSEVKETNFGLILAEVSESDSRLSRTMLERLEEVHTIAECPKTIVFFNSFDDQIRNYLMQNNYEIVHIRPDISLDNRVESVPTLQGTFSSYSCPQEVFLDVVNDDQGISKLLLECARDLARLNETFRTTECRAVLAKWWNLWRILKDLSIPLDTYERYRMHVQGRGSLENSIISVSNIANRIHTNEGKSLRLVAPVISNRLRTIYNALAQSCPKANRLMSLLNQAKSDSDRDKLFILSEKGQVDALLEYFLFNDIDLLDKQLPIVHFSQAVACARTMLIKNCILPGVWAPWQDSILVAIGASTITILMYPYEARLLETRVCEHQDECALLAENLISKESYIPILNLPEEQGQTLSAIKESTIEEAAVAWPPEWLRTEPESAIDTMETEDRVPEEEQSTGGLLIHLEDGSSMVARPHSELLIVTEDGVENIFAYELSEGDTLAVIRGDITRSIFQSVLSQVNHLIRVDNKVIDLWRSSIKRILFEDQPTGKTQPVVDIIQSLRSLGCRRVDLTIRQWFRGTTLAPQDAEDIRRILELAGIQRPSEVARVVSREIQVIRAFNRRLGRRINGQIRASITGHTQPARERIDFEIDEAIESVEYSTIVSIESLSGES